MIQAKLKLEIILGYLIWVSFFVLIVCIVHEEKEKKSAMELQETLWQAERQQTTRTFLQLLDLAATGERIAGWTEADYATYRKQRMETTALLQGMKARQRDAQQRACIDSVCLLLAEKERQMAALSQLLDNAPDAGEILHRKIPAIVSQTRKQTAAVAQPAPQPARNGSGKEKKGFWSFLHKKTGKSSYALQREKQKQNLPTRAASGRPSALLYSLEREIDESIRDYEERLATKIDSLQVSSQRLNGRISQFVRNFEQKEAEAFSREIHLQQTIRNHSFRLITSIGISAFLLVILLYAVIHRDVNRQHRLRRKLEELNRSNTALLNSRQSMMLAVSHDLRTPLTAVRGCTELLLGEHGKEKRDRLCQTVLQASERMLALLNNLLNFHRLDMGKEQPELAPFRLKPLFELLTEVHTPPAIQKGVRFTTEYIGVDAVVAGDKGRMMQIISNLLSNAVKFTQAGEVRLQATYAGSWLTVMVSDTGTGMDKEQLSRIFQPFTRLENAEAHEGFGLGLAITKGLTELLGGTIAVESETDKGSTFTVRLPLSAADEKLLQPPVTAIPALPADLKILAIDNDAVLLNMTKDMLAHYKLHCDVCLNVRDLMEQLRNYPYDLLITDIRMPDMNGFQLLELLRNARVGTSQTIPVLALTARAEKSREEFRKAGFAGCLYKPFSALELLAAVSSCVRREQAGKEIRADFTGLLSEESHQEEMLSLFIRETEEALRKLSDAASKGEQEGLSVLVHHLLPLWEIIKTDAPLRELSCRLQEADGKIDNAVLSAVETVIATGKQLVRQAGEKIKENRA